MSQHDVSLHRRLAARTRTEQLGLTALVLALFAGLMWAGWLGWDHSYYEVHGVPQGPYRPWQVLGCGLSIASATVVAHLWVRRAAGVVVLPIAADVGFAVPWAFDAASDPTGMWVVGLLMLLIAGSAGLMLLLVVTFAVTESRSDPGLALALCGVVVLVSLVAFPPFAALPLLAGLWVYARRRRDKVAGRAADDFRLE